MPEGLKALIVDDERLARRELRSMLAEFPQVEILGEAESVDQAIELIQLHDPEVVFLDIQLSGETGFDLLERSPGGYKVVFVTAFDSYAIRAFDVNALDYLLKPIHPTRLERAIERLTNPEAIRTASPVRPLTYDDRLFLEVDGQSRFLKVNAIVCIQAASDYSEIFTLDGRRLMVLKPLREWEERLPDQYFARIHRSAIINLEFVEHIENWSHRACRVFLRNMAEPLVISRRYVTRLKLKFG
ncbi:MAG TPA: LytTR family DNA-binding domain-containing protein [Acidobacteriota bacterium]|nr:LytTR family DNA-binding domain-containing protein [Acidobacteriota bacterium]